MIVDAAGLVKLAVAIWSARNGNKAPATTTMNTASMIVFIMLVTEDDVEVMAILLILPIYPLYYANTLFLLRRIEVAYILYYANTMYILQ